jgi:hypothetical protein
MALRQLAADIWETEAHWVSGFNFRARMTVVRLPSGGLWLHSPVALDDDLTGELEALGPVAHIVAPSRYHHMFAPAAAARYPQATLWAAPTLPDKLPDVSFDAVLGERDAPWSDAIDSLFITGMPMMCETIFFHNSSRTLICTDFFFNIQSEEGWGTRQLWRAMGVWQHPGQSRSWRMLTRDKAAARLSLDAIWQWPVERIVMGHGDVIESDAMQVLRRALTWLVTP